jgi:hypothetical protein
MKNTNITSKSLIIAFFIFFATLTACKKDNTLRVIKPELGQVPSNNGRDTITVGDSLVLHPKLNKHDKLIYNWTVNGESIGTDSVFSFKGTERGTYNVTFKAVNSGGETSVNYQIHVFGKYENGFFIVNEGWFGHGTGNVNFFRYNTHTLEDSIFTKENPDKNLEPLSSTLEFGAIYNDRFYLLSKSGGPLVVTDAHSFKEIKRIAGSSTHNWRAFVGIDNQRGLVSTAKGVFPIDLNSLEIGTQISGINGQVGDLIKAGNYVFILSQTDGVVIINASDYTIVKKIPSMQVGLAQTKDGAIWSAGGKVLSRIDAKSLEVTQIAVPFTVYGTWGTWHAGSITASNLDNSVYFAKNSSWGSSGKEIYKYNGDLSSLEAPFISLPTGKELIGTGLRFDKYLNQLVVITVKSGYGVNYAENDIYFYHSQTGAQISNYNYSGYYFPAIPVFH